MGEVAQESCSTGGDVSHSRVGMHFVSNGRVQQVADVSVSAGVSMVYLWAASQHRTWRIYLLGEKIELLVEPTQPMLVFDVFIGCW